MRVAVPSADDKGLDSKVFPHFGRAPYYTLVDVEDGEATLVEVLRNPNPEPGHQHGRRELFEALKEKGVELVLAYSIGPRAVENLEALGMRAVPGARGKVGDVVKAFAEGRLEVDEGWVRLRRLHREREGD